MFTKDPETKVWYALQTSYGRELALQSYLENQSINSYIPMRHAEADEHLVPAVHNLLFMEKTCNAKQLEQLTTDSPIPFWIVKHRHSAKPYEISDREMREMQAVCNPDYTGILYTDKQTAQARPGQLVRVIRGPFKGLEGKLTQYKRRYYVVITVATMGVMIHIPKWYCEKI